MSEALEAWRHIRSTVHLPKAANVKFYVVKDLMSSIRMSEAAMAA